MSQDHTQNQSEADRSLYRERLKGLTDEALMKEHETVTTHCTRPESRGQHLILTHENYEQMIENLRDVDAERISRKLIPPVSRPLCGR